MVGGFLITGKGNTIEDGATASGKSDWESYSSTAFYSDTFKGEPRFDDLFTVRVLGKTAYVEMVKDIIKSQVANTDFQVLSYEEDPDEATLKRLDEEHSWLRAGMEGDQGAWDSIIRMLLDDILDFDSGVIEKKFDTQGYLLQCRVRDGLTFTINRDEKGGLPDRGSEEPAYYQFSMNSFGHMAHNTERTGLNFEELNQTTTLTGGAAMLPHSFYKEKNIPFTRDQIAWFMESPRSYSSYGRGRTQKVKQFVEILLNGDIHRGRFFQENEFHKGFIQILDANQADIKRLQDRLHQSRGNEYKVPVIPGGNASWVSMVPDPSNMQFLESHKWYVTATLMAYGLNESEAGNHENANLSVSDEMKFNIWRRTTEPLLHLIEDIFNTEILPYRKAYHETGGYELVFSRSNEFLRRLEQSIEEKDLSLGVLTVNEVRRKHAEEDYGLLGDLPKVVFDSLAQKMPSWVASQLNPSLSPPPDTPQNVFSFTPDKQRNNEDDDNDDQHSLDAKEGVVAHPKLFKDYGSLFTKELSVVKEALRNSPDYNQHPPLKGLIDEEAKKIGGLFKAWEEPIISFVEQEFSGRSHDKPVLNARAAVKDLSLDELGDVLVDANQRGLETSAEFYGKTIEKQVEEKSFLPTEAKVALDFDLADTFTARALKEQALIHAKDIEEGLKRRLVSALVTLVNKGGSIEEAEREIMRLFEGITKERARLIARTEILSASRQGSQALAETTPLIAGKEWIATRDGRTREWHRAMDGVIIPKDSLFTVPGGYKGQSKSFPKSSRVVGATDPFNCRCSQAPVLREDMPGFKDFRKHNLRLVGLTQRQVEVWQEHGKAHKSFWAFWKHSTDTMARKELTSRFKMSETTVQKWNIDAKKTSA